MKAETTTAGRGRRDDIGGTEADPLGSARRRTKNITSTRPTRQYWTMWMRCRREQLQHEDGEEGDADEHHAVFQGALDQGVEIDRLDETDAQQVAAEAGKAVALEDPGLRRRAGKIGHAPGRIEAASVIFRSDGSMPTAKFGCGQLDGQEICECRPTGAMRSESEPRTRRSSA